MSVIRPVIRPAVLESKLPDGIARLIAFAGGALTVLAFAPFGWRVFSLLGPAVLLLLWLTANARETFLRGYAWGLGFFGFGVSWVFISFSTFGGAPFLVAFGLTALFVLVLAAFLALAGYLINRYLPGGPGGKLLLAFPAAWVLSEWLRSWVLTGFPWLLLGDAQIDTPLSTLVPVFGELGASWAVVLLAGALVYLLVAQRGRVMTLLGLTVFAAVMGLAPEAKWTEAEGEPLTVSVVQGNIPQDEKWDPAEREHTMLLYRDLTRRHFDSDLIVWPETAIPAYYMQAQEFIESLDSEARAKGSLLLTGIFHYDPEQDLAYNALVSLGDTRHYYYKRHLVPFGEYMPFRFLLNWLNHFLDIPMNDLSAGDGRPLMRFDRFSVGLSICYEDAYGVEMIDALPEADVLINVSNDGWFGDSLAPHQHLELARVRALETGRYLLRATNTGISAIIGPNGEIVGRSPQFETHVLTGAIHRMRGMTPFVQFGRVPVVVLAGLVLVFCVYAGRRSGVTVQLGDLSR